MIHRRCITTWQGRPVSPKPAWKRFARQHQRCAPPARSRNPHQRQGVTLVELLVSITILSMLASAILFASFSATKSARTAATRAKVANLHGLLMEKYESFRTRRVHVPAPAGSLNLSDWQSKVVGPRLTALRILMRMEMPDRWSDVVLAPISKFPPGKADINTAYPQRVKSGRIDVERTSLSRAYLRKYNSLKTTDLETIRANQGAECLYMVISLATAEGEALSLFRESDIGDIDGDGAPEFHDGWGRPIHYLYSAPGFTELSDLQTNDPNLNHDPFDVYRVDSLAYRLVPLIYSAGPDGDPDLNTDKDIDEEVASNSNVLPYWIEPYVGRAALLGAANPDDDGDNWTDNIHNHLQDVR